MDRHSLHHGFVFLLSVLVIGIVFAATTMTLLLLGRTAYISSQTNLQSQQALELANSCADIALQGLHDSDTYAGNQDLTFPQGDCHIYSVSSSGTARTVCTEGLAGNTVRRFQITLTLPPGSAGSSSSVRSAPPPAIGMWNEVPCCSVVNGAGGCRSSS